MEIQRKELRVFSELAALAKLGKVRPHAAINSTEMNSAISMPLAILSSVGDPRPQTILDTLDFIEKANYPVETLRRALQ
jgi:hypothetical protein